LPSIARIKEERQVLILRHGRSEDGKGLVQVLTTLVPIALTWWLLAATFEESPWFAFVAAAVIALFTLRAFVMMHECGHGSLFRTPWLNRAFGFVMGVVTGMPQYVWSQHHNFHHVNNGNWEKYRGPLSTASVEEYAAMSESCRRRYRNLRCIALAPFGGFVYLLFNPRFTWLRGSALYLVHIARGKLAHPFVPVRQIGATFRTGYWKSGREYWHMAGNNLVLLAAWGLLAGALGPALFFPVYLAAISLAGAAGLVLFTVQHNFEHSYASDSASWDCVAGTLRGTSFLILPRWLNWFTADIAYHHIHHLSSCIPNYRLASCHGEFEELFVEVVRLRLSQIPGAMKCILWDRQARRIISVAEYDASRAQGDGPQLAPLSPS